MMTLSRLFSSCFALFICAQLFGADAPTPVAPAAAPKGQAPATPTVSPKGQALAAAEAPAAKASDTDCLSLFGWLLGRQSGASELNLTPDELKLVTANFVLGCEGKDAPVDPRKVGPSMQDFLQARFEAYSADMTKKMEKEAQANKEAAKAFFTKLASDKKITKTPSGLYYEILAAGKAPKPTPQDMVEVNYSGKLINGSVFDSSYDRGEPAIFSLEGIIPGAREGLQLIGEGGKIRLYIPSDLGYGDRDIPGIPPGSALIFEFELLKVNPPELIIETDQVNVQAVPMPTASNAATPQASPAKPAAAK
ncbi:MAG: hypothetical protein B7X06_04430 [Verrucomicrobia bacterium 21-51-4]|nr:MAG: hypothetical protein B7X06_04430 [Verrucomicrobia bacterium 21-51-4]HQU09576.1 FKBP-type peptidyl-prolyl cis-trans isomerase [Opitutales bacterium]